MTIVIIKKVSGQTKGGLNKIFLPRLDILTINSPGGRNSIQKSFQEK